MGDNQADAGGFGAFVVSMNLRFDEMNRRLGGLESMAQAAQVARENDAFHKGQELQRLTTVEKQVGGGQKWIAGLTLAAAVQVVSKMLGR